MKPVLTLLASIILTLTSTAQKDWGEFTMKGRLSEINLLDSSEHLIADVPIEIWVDDSLSSTLYTDEKGRYKFSLPYFHSYKVRYGRAPYVQKSVVVDARDFSQSTMERGFKLEIDVTMFKEDGSERFAFLRTEPVAIASYNKIENTVVWDGEHTERINKRIREAALKPRKQN